MNDNQSQTESLLDIVNGIRGKTIMLPEFQRDFRWELEQTYDLFDSLIRDIFIGTIIYGKPSFEMTLREIDERPRKGKGSRVSLKTSEFSAAEIHAKTRTENFRIILDGQQRITSIYRAVVGIDSVYVVLRDGLDPATVNELSLQQMMGSVAGEEESSAISIRLSDAYEAEREGLDDEELNRRFAQSLYARRRLKDADQATRTHEERLYRRGVRRLIDLCKQQKLIAYYLLDMSLDKFCAFFERSNSRGIQLNFTDILAAKLYGGFNLRRKIEEFESQSRFALNREAVVRAIAYICGAQGAGDAIQIDKSYILEHLRASDFQAHWDEVCELYTGTLQYLTVQHYILSQDWMPSDNMVIPIMMFCRAIGDFSRINESQRSFLEFWYWASIFSNRYSGPSNEAIIGDSTALIQVARSEAIRDRGYFARLRSRVTEPDDLLSYSKRASAIYRGMLNLLAYHSKGLLDWNSAQEIDISMKLENHHIYPRAFIATAPELDIGQDEAEELVDCVANRTLIAKSANVSIGKKPPQIYLAELQRKNPRLEACLPGHLIPADMIKEPMWNSLFREFLNQRAQRMFDLIRSYAIDPADLMAAKHGTQVDNGVGTTALGRLGLGDAVGHGEILVGNSGVGTGSAARAAATRPARSRREAPEASAEVCTARPRAVRVAREEDAAAAGVHPGEQFDASRIEGWELIQPRFRENRVLERLFEAVHEEVRQVCPGAICYANREVICFKRSRIFIVLDVRKDSLDLGIAVGPQYAHPRIQARPTRGGKGGWNGWGPEYQGLRVRTPDELDEDFRHLVRLAYETYGTRQRR
jgi:hypothetical protein